MMDADFSTIIVKYESLMPGLFGHVKKHSVYSDAIERIASSQMELYPVSIEHQYQDDNLAAVRCYSFYEKKRIKIQQRMSIFGWKELPTIWMKWLINISVILMI